MESAKEQSRPARWPVRAAILAVAAAALITAWSLLGDRAKNPEPEYYAVLLTNGQVYYGRLEGYGGVTPVLREVYYVEARAQSNVLLRRRQEWHGPDRMLLNPAHIVLVEPVGADSQVASLIRQAKAQK